MDFLPFGIFIKLLCAFVKIIAYARVPGDMKKFFTDWRLWMLVAVSMTVGWFSALTTGYSRIQRNTQLINEYQNRETVLKEAYILLSESVWKIVSWDKIDDNRASITIRSDAGNGHGGFEKNILVNFRFITETLTRVPDIRGRRIILAVPHNYVADYADSAVLGGLLVINEVK